MKAVLLPENLINYVPLLLKILPTHSQVPILSNIYMEASKDGLILKTTNLELGAQVKIPAKVEREGSTTIPGKEFLEAITMFPKNKIEIEAEKEQLKLSAGDVRVSFNTISGTEFPQLFKSIGEKVIEFGKEEFLALFSNLTFSVSREEARPQLTGIFIDPVSDGVNFVSTDGYRMSVNKMRGERVKDKEGLIVSVRLVNEVVSLKTGERVSLYVSKPENQVIFESGEALIVGRMIEGIFPDYTGVIPKSSRTVVDFDKEELLQNVKLASVFAKESSNIATLKIEGNSLIVETKTQGVGEGKTMIECETSGEDVTISFNIHYLLDLLKNLTAKSVTLKLNSGSEPALFEVSGQDFLHVIMPIQTDN